MSSSIPPPESFRSLLMGRIRVLRQALQEAYVQTDEAARQVERVEDSLRALESLEDLARTVEDCRRLAWETLGMEVDRALAGSPDGSLAIHCERIQRKIPLFENLSDDEELMRIGNELAAIAAADPELTFNRDLFVAARRWVLSLALARSSSGSLGPE